MRVLDDYTCRLCGKREERLARIGDAVYCTACGARCNRDRAVPNFQLETISGDFPTATRRWEQDYARRAAKAREHDE